MLIFNKPFTQQESLPEQAIEMAVEVLKSGRLHRYNVIEGETAHAALLEQEFSQYMGQKYCLACASGGYALHIALKVVGLEVGDKVLTNAFTLAPVPGAIHNAGGVPVLIEVDENLCTDLTHLEMTMQSSGAKYFMLSHMRGHLADMDKIVALCHQYGVILIEDCAHTMGATWDSKKERQTKKSGTFGDIACFSTQTYKHINSGEGGLLTTDNDEYMARAIIYSGSYMLYERHGTPPPSTVFDRIRTQIPNYSGRMDNLRAAILRAQLPQLDENCRRWNNLYQRFEKKLQHNAVIFPKRPEAEYFVGSSIQFSIPNLENIEEFIADCAKRGVELKWFGSATPHGFTSRYDSWHYLDDTKITLPQTLAVLSHLFDMRLSLTFDDNDMMTITDIIKEVLNQHLSKGDLL